MKPVGSTPVFFKQENHAKFKKIYSKPTPQQIFQRNKEHKRNFEEIYKSLSEISFKQNRIVEDNRGHKLYNFDKLHGEGFYELDDGRDLIIRFVKIPTFTRDNAPRYYVVFLCFMDWWQIGNIASLRKSCMDLVKDHHDIDSIKSFTIFLAGKQRGFIKKSAKTTSYLRKHNTILINSNSRHCDEARSTVFKSVLRFIEQRCIRIYQSINSQTYIYGEEKRRKHIYGALRTDWQRLNNLVGVLRKFFKNFRRIWMKKKINNINEQNNISNSNNKRITDRRRYANDKFNELLQNFGKRHEKNIIWADLGG